MILQCELERPRADVQGQAHVLLAQGIHLISEERFEEARIELENVLETESLSKVPIVILGNKIDKKEAVPEEQLR